jgi:hypothetical protein
MMLFLTSIFQDQDTTNKLNIYHQIVKQISKILSVIPNLSEGQAKHLLVNYSNY